MTTYQVYLPPVLTPLKDLNSAVHIPISFRHVSQPASYNSLSQSFSQRRHLLHGRQAAQAENDDRALRSPIEMSGLSGGGRADIAPGGMKKGKRRAVEEPSQSSSGPSSRRESARLRKAGPNIEGQSSEQSARPVPALPSQRSDHNPMSGASPPSPRRRSHRLARTSESTLAALPIGLNTTDSLLSLNTTASQISFPPTAQGDTSVANLPRWHIPLARLNPLQTLLRGARSRGDKGLTLIVCVTSVEEPVLRRRKEERSRGMEGTLWVARWDVIAPPTSEHADVGCEVRLWEACARDWGGSVRRGDVVLLDNVEYRPATRKDKPQLILSPTQTHTPKPTILYRTLPRYATTTDYIYQEERPGGRVIPEDRVLRPDLRLGRSDPGVRRVGEVAGWFAEWVGGVPP